MLKVFGLGKEALKKIDLVNRILGSGNKEHEKEVEVLGEMKEVGCFNPKLSAKMNYLYKTQKGCEELAKLEVERLEIAKNFTTAIAEPLVAHLSEIVPEGMRLAVLKKEKKVNGRLIEITSRDFPIGLEYFINPVNLKRTPHSVVTVSANDKVSEVTGQTLVEVKFVSVCFDVVKEVYVQHNWVVTYEVTKDNYATADEIAGAEEALEDSEEIF